MNQGVWVWTSDPKGQRRVLRQMAGTPHVMAALNAIAKSKDGLSNSELDELLKDNANWITLWAVRQLQALGFIEYRVDLFGGPARYALTALGMEALSTLSGQPTPKPAPPAQPAPQPVQVK